jgi:archaemetzincin
MSAIHLLPLGNPSPELIEAVHGPLEQTFKVGVEEHEFAVDLDPFLDDHRGQYNSTRILMHLKEAYTAPIGDPGSKTLAIVPYDLFIPILTYVFGEAEVGGSVAVVSYYRLAPERYGLAKDRKLLQTRLVKEAIHELGHAFSLIHCSRQQCVMHSSSYVEEIDLKESDFCDACRAGLPFTAECRPRRSEV